MYSSKVSAFFAFCFSCLPGSQNAARNLEACLPTSQQVRWQNVVGLLVAPSARTSEVALRTQVRFLPTSKTFLLTLQRQNCEFVKLNSRELRVWWSGRNPTIHWRSILWRTILWLWPTKLFHHLNLEACATVSDLVRVSITMQVTIF